MVSHAVVIGGGIVGSSVALELGRRGYRVTVIEQEAQVGQGSTLRSSSVIRCHYTREEAVALAYEGQRLWANWAHHVQLSHPRATYHPVGVLFLLRQGDGGPPSESLGVKAEMDQKGIIERMETMRRVGVPTELFIGKEALGEALPSFHFHEEGIAGVWEPDSGYVFPPEGAVVDLREAGEAIGVAYRLETTFLSAESDWKGERRQIRSIRIEHKNCQETLPCDVLVNCAGPASHRINQQVSCPLPLTTTPQRQFIIEASFANPDGRALPAMADLVEGFYVRPDKNIFKVGAVLAADHVDFSMDSDDASLQDRAGQFEERLLSALSRRIPNVRLKNIKTRTAYYDWTVSDSYPILDSTDVGGYYVAIGTSGAWYKSGPVIGYLMAELIERTDANDDNRVMTLPYSQNQLDLALFSSRRSES
ncbi:MAG: hypothetical protein CMH54_13005 [Myxococcales bacterium]|nr:hypothetical protein [Myxococcales bacterium]